MAASDDTVFETVAHPFHDDSIYGMKLVTPEPERGLWRSGLVLDIDHIVEWIKGADGVTFRLVQADLVFEGVSDLRVSFGFPDSTVTPLAIDGITRSDGPVVERGEYREYQWTITLNDRAGGSISLRATGYRLIHRGKPAVYDEQVIPPHLRREDSAG